MTYQPNIPLANDPLDVSQVDINANFTTLNTYFSTDHIALDAATAQGEHKKVTFNDVLGADPGLTNPKSSEYTKTIAHGGTNFSELFYESTSAAGAGSNIIRQLTGIEVTNAGTDYGITTPWGLKLNWGLATTAAGGNPVTVTFQVPFTSGVQSATVSAISNVSGSSNVRAAWVSDGSVGLNSFAIRGTNQFQVYYFVIGV